MYSIAYVVPYFGKLPNGFQFWLLSCGCNPSVDWLLFTDDHTEYEYPPNVIVTYCTFDKIKEKAQAVFDFPISLERPYKLCDYRPAYGEIFAEELTGYDFWGYCDVDMVWGDIRKFFTNDVLKSYKKIGFNGHSTLFKNEPEVCAYYKTVIEGEIGYREVLTKNQGYAFDEGGIDAVFDGLDVPVYRGIDFANLLKYDYGFYLDWKGPEEAKKNKRQVFTWKDGVLTRYFLVDGEMGTEEYLYLHYWCRPTTFKIKEYRIDKQYLIYADTTTDRKYEITPSLIYRKSIRNPARFYAKSLWRSRKKITPERIVFNIKGMFKYKRNRAKKVF